MKRNVRLAPWCGVVCALVWGLGAGCVPGGETGPDDGNNQEREEDVGEAASALSESEPNNQPGQAGVKTITFGDDNFGSLSAADTVDLWQLVVPAKTYINVYLGNIPAGSNYNLELQQNGVSLWSGTKSGNADEIGVKVPVQAGTYVLKVSAVQNPQANAQYLLRSAVTAVSRAKEWVAVQMPYCGAAQGQGDVICGGTCNRPAAAQKPQWDVYRSDCSGYVSFAWGLPAPGPDTSALSSYFSPIAVQDLAPGDILLHQTSGDKKKDPGHTFLFEKWVDKAAKKARILEEQTCGTVASSKEVVFGSVSSSTTTTYLGTTYTARRFNMP